jgi:hypothetical protein
MISPTTKLFQQLVLWQKILKWVERGLFSYYVIGIFWIIGTNWLCKGQNCDLNVNRIDIGLVIQIAFAISGILNSVRIAIVYMIHDKDPKPEKSFFVSLVLMALSYLIFGYYFENDTSGFIQYSDNPVLYVILGLSIFSCTVINLLDKQSWHQNSPFVITRVSLTLFNLIIMFFSPVLGFLTALLIIPAFMFIDDRAIVKGA